MSDNVAIEIVADATAVLEYALKSYAPDYRIEIMRGVVWALARSLAAETGGIAKADVPLAAVENIVQGWCV